MPRYLKIIVIFIFFSAFASPASSELYQYVDENGITRLTDNIYSVPANSRSKLEQFTEFESLSDDLEILPVQKKPMPQSKKQAESKQDLSPKTSKTISAETEKNIIHPDAEKKTVAETKKDDAPDPFQPIVSEKPVQEPDTEVTASETYKSSKISIERADKKDKTDKKAHLPLTAQTVPEKELKKTDLPEIKTKTIPEITPKTKKDAKIAVKPADEKIIARKAEAKPEPEAGKKAPSKIASDDKKTAFDSKTVTPTQKPDQETAPKSVVTTKITDTETAKSQTLKEAEKSAGSDTQKTDTPKIVSTPKPATEIIKADTRVTGKSAETEAGKETDRTAAEKKEITPKEGFTDKKTEDSSKTQKMLAETKSEADMQPVVKDRTLPEVKTEVTIAAKPSSEKSIPQKTEPKPEKTAPQKIMADEQLTAVVDKPAKKEPIQKTVINDKTAAAIKKEAAVMPEKSAKAESLPETANPAITKKAIKTKSYIATKPAADSHPATPEIQEKTTKKIDAPKIETQAAPEIRKAATAAPESLPAKDPADLKTADKTDQKLISETKRTESAIREKPPRESNSITDFKQTPQAGKNDAAHKAGQADSSEADKKNESIVLAKLESTRKILFNKKEALNKKFLALMKEKQEIENSVDENDEASVLKYNESVKKLNLKIKQYKKDKKILQVEIERYNNTIKQSASN